MPAPIIIVIDDQEARETARRALDAASFHVATFDDPIAALNAVEKDSSARVLVSLTNFGQGKLNGLALVRMLRHKQIVQDGKSSLRGVFIGPAANGHQAKKEGEYLPMPIDPNALVDAVGKAFRTSSK